MSSYFRAFAISLLLLAVSGANLADANGNTWRSMDNGTTLWWNGTDWQQT